MSDSETLFPRGVRVRDRCTKPVRFMATAWLLVATACGSNPPAGENDSRQLTLTTEANTVVTFSDTVGTDSLGATYELTESTSGDLDFDGQPEEIVVVKDGHYIPGVTLYVLQQGRDGLVTTASYYVGQGAEATALQVEDGVVVLDALYRPATAALAAAATVPRRTRLVLTSAGLMSVPEPLAAWYSEGGMHAPEPYSREWVLEAFENVAAEGETPIPEGIRVRLLLEHQTDDGSIGQIHVMGACRQLLGIFTVPDRGRVRFRGTAETLQACTGSAGVFDTLLLDAFRTATHWEVAGDTLVFRFDRGTIRLAPGDTIFAEENVED